MNDSKTTFYALLFDAQPTGSRKAHHCQSSKQLHQQLEYPCLLGLSYFKMGQRLGIMRHVTIVSHSCQILLGQQFYCNNLHTYFPTHMTHFRTLFNGSQSLFSFIIQYIQSARNEENLYLRDWSPPSSSCRKG